MDSAIDRAFGSHTAWLWGPAEPTLQAGKPDLICSANIGCLTHLQSGTATPVRRWVEVIDEVLAA